MAGSASACLVSIYATLSVLAASSTAASGKLDRCLDFSAYPASSEFNGPNASPNIGKSSPGHGYRTLIRSKANSPANFAGYLEIIEFGCGSDCHLILIIDREAGDVWLPEAKRLGAALGYGYHVASRLLVVDPP